MGPHLVSDITKSDLRVKKGCILLYRIFDIAEEINIGRVEALLRNNRGPDRFNVPKFIDRALIMKRPPVSFALGTETINIQGRTLKADVLVKIRDFGVLSVIYQINIESSTSWFELIQMASDLEEGSEIDALALKHVKEITATIQDALKKPAELGAFEDYIIYFIEEFENGVVAKDLAQRPEVAPLLLAEDKVKISDLTRKSVIENMFQYSESDLAIIEWNSALVVEPGGGREVTDILEFAVTHLMEMRFYDELLDQKLAVLYNDIEKHRASIWSSRFDKTYQDASARYIEFSEFIERVENSLKVVGDFYLATVYRAATKKFRISDWQQNITRKMNILAQVSSLLQGELNVRRSHWMEIIIIILIGYEIVSAVWR